MSRLALGGFQVHDPPAMPASVVSLLFVATSVAYAAASALFVGYLFGTARRWIRVAPAVLGVAVVLHAGHIAAASAASHVCPVTGVHFAVSVIALIACITFLLVRFRYPVDVVGAFVAPLALTAVLASRFVAAEAAPSPRFRSALLPLHVTMNLLGDALFSLAFAAAALYLVQEKQLKRKRLVGVFQRLPPLDWLDMAEHRFLLGAFPLLTIGVVTGSFWALQVERGGASEMLRAAFAYATWLVMAGVLLLRAAAGWRGRRAAYGTIAGFGFAVLVLVLYLLRASAPSEVAASSPSSGPLAQVGSAAAPGAAP